jgi:hypothetical protein
MADGHTNKSTHPTVMAARNTLLVFGLMGAWSIWLVVALPANAAVIAGGVVPILVLWLGRQRVARRTKTFNFAEGDERPDRLAWVPLWCVIIAFMGYGITLTLVHNHYFAVKTSAFGRQSRVEDRELKAEAADLSKATKMLTRLEKRLEREPNSRRAATIEKEGTELAAVDHVLNTGDGNIQKASAGLQRIHFVHKGTAYLEAAFILAEQKLEHYARPLPAPPSETELPPWFGRLGGFFTVATQLLAGLAAVLAFSRWRAGVSEAVWRTAMPVAVVGVAFGLAGNLPSLSRPLQAIFLAPVLAGLAGALGGLIVASMESHTQSAPPDGDR